MPTKNTAKKIRTVTKAKKRAWDIFSKYIRTRDALETTGSTFEARCISCNRIYPAFGLKCLQAGHFIPGRTAANLFEERGVHAQCYNCNVNLKGNWPAYYEAMMKKYGQETIDELLATSRVVLSRKVFELDEIHDLYRDKLKGLTS